jgi:hypothetical protein
MTQEAIAMMSVAATVFSGLMVAWIRWSIRAAVKETVNGKVDRVNGKVDEVLAWMKIHDATHSAEQLALLSALGRQGLSPPDGWVHEHHE